MTGLLGTTADGDSIDDLGTEMVREDWYDLAAVREGDAAAGVLEHGSRDSDANVVLCDDGLLGVVYGVVSNRDRLSRSWSEIFRALADESRTVLPDLEGPFALACVDTRTDRVHLATDKAGSRPVYYAADDAIRFASELSPLLSAVDSPALDPAAVSDLLLAGGVLGERTLVEGVASLPPATRLTFDGADGSVSTERYWAPEPAGLAPSGYPDRWLDAYRSAVSDLATTAGDPSLWFPGDAGSRIAAAVLAAAGCPIETLTCGGPAGGDREAAAQVSAYLDLPNRQGHDDPDRHLVDAVADAVAATDGMVEWTAVDALPYATDRLHDDADALVFGRSHLEAAPWVGALGADDDPVAALAAHECVLSPETVEELLATDRDPLASLEAAVTDSVAGPTERTAVDATLRIRSATRLRPRAVQRSQVGTRALAHGAFLDTVARMPACYRTETIPISGPTEAGEPPIRAAAVRRLDANLAQIPAGSDDRARADGSDGFRADGGESTVARSEGDAYVRRYASDDRFRRFVDDLLDRVADRDPVDADGVAALRERLVSGELPAFAPVAALTGLELWAGRHLDGGARTVDGVEA